MMKIKAEMEWRDDEFGKTRHAFYLGALCVGHIMQSTHPEHHLGQWRGWFMDCEDGNATGWFISAEDARASVELKLFEAIQITRD